MRCGQAGRARTWTDGQSAIRCRFCLSLSLYLGGKEDGSNAMRREGGGDDGDGATADEAIQKRASRSVGSPLLCCAIWHLPSTYAPHACSMYSR